MPPPREGPPLIPPPRASSGGNFVVRAAAAADNLDTAEASGAGDEVDSEGPPLEVLEAGMSAELAERDAGGRATPRRQALGDVDDEDDAKADAALPEPEALSARLAPELRDTLEELLRLRFSRVKKIPRKHLAGG